MTAQLVTASELARELNVSPTAVHKARDSGRLTPIGDRFDLAVAKIQWETNRKRQRRDRPPPPPDLPAGTETPAQSGGSYWDAKTRREQAEASIAELKELELRGDLVRKVEVERALAARLVALRESLEVLADRLAALVAAESDAGVCRRLIRDEHRKALTMLAEHLETVEEADDGSA